MFLWHDFIDPDKYYYLQTLNRAIQTVINGNRMMENDKNSKLNSYLNTSTSRQFYSRRIPAPTNHQTSRYQLQKIIKMLNLNPDPPKPTSKYGRLKTEGRDSSFEQTEKDITRIELRNKIQFLLKKQCKRWKELYDAYEKMKVSTSKEGYINNEVDFYTRMLSMMIRDTEKQKQRKCAVKTLEDESNRKERIVEIQNVKLYKENMLLKEKFVENLSIPFSPSLQRQPSCQSRNFNSRFTIDEDEHMQLNQQSFQKLKLKLKIMSQQLCKLRQQLIVSNQQVSLMKDEKKTFNDKVNEMKIANENLCAHILNIQSSQSNHNDKIQQWKNIMALQREEIASHQSQKKLLRQELLDLDRKYKATLKRINKVGIQNNGKIPEISKKCLEIFVEQLQCFQKIRSFNASKNYYSISDRSNKDLMNVSINGQTSVYRKFLTPKETLSNQNGIKKIQRVYYTYLKPTFYHLIEKYMQSQGVDRNNFSSINIELNFDFLATIRTIMDSKHNEFMIYKDNFKQISTFSSFCFSWLCNFQIDSKTKKVVEVNSDINFETIGTFYIRLMNEKMNLNWEIVTFRQFLLESLTADELYFYLRTRHILFKGDLMEILSGVYSDVYYINYLDALFLVQTFVTDFDYRKKIEEYLKKSIDYQRKRQLIDAHYVLRLLLEFYIYKKNQIYSYLSKFFQTSLKEKSNLSIDVFLRAFDYNFASLTLIDKIEIYQKCFSLNKGQINAQSLFTVLNQEKYLCLQVMKLFSYIKIQKKECKNQDGEPDFILQPNNQELYEAEHFHEMVHEGILKNFPCAIGLQIFKKKKQEQKKSKLQQYSEQIQLLIRRLYPYIEQDAHNNENQRRRVYFYNS